MAGHFHAQNVGRAGRRRIKPTRLQQIGIVEARGRDLDQDFAGAGHRAWDLSPSDKPVIATGIFRISMAFMELARLCRGRTH